MRVIYADAYNFQSYDSLTFGYDKLGLSLVSGPTGSGKSTLFDIVAWTLFGITSKDGASDSVRSWGSKAPTKCRVRLSLPTGDVSVTRKRGEAGQNDLSWTEMTGPLAGPIKRGKDLIETQKLLNDLLGVTPELFLTGSYLTQFSKADSFFIASAKDRRETLEKIADQAFAISLGEKALEVKKSKKKSKEIIDLQIAEFKGKGAMLARSLKQAQADAALWSKHHGQRVAQLTAKTRTFQDDRAAAILDLNNQMLDLVRHTVPDDHFDQKEAKLRERSEAPSVCVTCGQRTDNEHIAEELHALSEARRANQSKLNRTELLQSAINNKEQEVDRYGEQLESVLSEKCPHSDRIISLNKDNMAHSEKEINLTSDQAQLRHEIAALTYLYDKSLEMRGLLMTQAVRQIEHQTNLYLERYFDATIRISLTCADSDRIEIDINNDGHSAPFKSLSGGERCMLKLCFSLSLMRAAQNKAGVKFNAVFLDEPLNGLDSELKVKAFGVLQDLEKEYDTVLVIEHSEELKQQFDRVFHVAKEDGHSYISD